MTVDSAWEMHEENVDEEVINSLVKEGFLIEEAKKILRWMKLSDLVNIRY